MIEFLTTSELASAIEKVFRTAEKRIVIISPYIQMSKNYITRLRSAEERGVRITVVFGKSELDDRQNDILSSFDRLALFYCDNLHAKCYMNESSAVIGSMNLYEYSQHNNFEMGVLIRQAEEPRVFKEVEAEVAQIRKASNQLFKDDTPFLGAERRQTIRTNSGYCIRCGTLVPPNPNYPLCRSCFDEWSQYKNFEYLENVCHACGKDSPTSMARPLCLECYRSF